MRIAPSSAAAAHDAEPTFAATSRSAPARHGPADTENSHNVERFRFATAEEVEPAKESVPLIGSIQERTGLQRSEAKPVARKELSRFSLSRKEGKAPENAAKGPTSSDETDLEWLDEDGQPMSAFRRDRLRRQGLRPPAVGSSRMQHRVPSEDAYNMPKASGLKGEALFGGVDSIMSTVSSENEAKVAAMSVQEVELSLAELRESLGGVLLDKLKARKGGESQEVVSERTTSMPREQNPAKDQQKRHTSSTTQQPSQVYEQTSEQIRDKYFPNESDNLPLSLQWTRELDQEEQSKPSNTIRFDFSGHAIPDGRAAEDESWQAGLHHHGSEQHRAGYSLSELLHLARSTLPSQRILALQTLERVFCQYLERSPLAEEGESFDKLACNALSDDNIRGKAAVVASWYVEDRQLSTRSAALRCLRSCLFTTLAGPCPVRGVAVQYSKARGGTAATYDLKSDDFGLALVPLLCNALARGAMPSSDLEISLNILHWLCSRSLAICAALAARPDDISSITKMCISNRQWPATKLEERPMAVGLQLLLTLVSSQRSTAASLVERGNIDVLLRFLAVPPWVMGEGEGKNMWVYFDLTLQIYAVLASYGIYSDVLQRGYSVLPAIQDWIRTVEVDTDDNLQLLALRSSLKCLSLWTVCAIDPHQTQGHHDIGWSHVADWWDCALACGKRLTASSSFSSAPVAVTAAAETISLLHNWLDCAEQNGQLIQARVEQEVASTMENCLVLIDQLCTRILQSSEEMSVQLSGQYLQPFWKTGLSQTQQLAELCEGADKVVRFITEKPHIMAVPVTAKHRLLQAARSILSGRFWNRLDHDDAIQTGVAGLRRSIVAFCCRAVESFSSDLYVDYLRILVVLRRGEEGIAERWIMKVLPAKTLAITSSDLLVLRPFLAEMLRPTMDPLTAPLHVTSRSLPITSTLFANVPLTNDEEDLDPLSGATLWKSCSTGLPLRPDWPLIALDDLLHSGNCASLNRQNALNTDWDANERQIVISSLRVGVQMWEGVLEEEKSGTCIVLPSAAEVHLAIIKVFLLEEEQSPNSNATGLITGKDLYRDPEISSLLERMFSIAKRIDEADNGVKDDLEAAAHRQFGPSLPFYQMYTTFLGLYDAMSFGWELFGRAVLLPQSSDYADDYKRLLWIDYSHCLTTLRTSAADSPYHQLSRFVSLGGTDKGVARAMLEALITGAISRDRNGLAFCIATRQIAHLIWTHNGEEGEALVRALSSAPKTDPSVMDAIRSEGLTDGPTRRTEEARRSEVLRTVP